MAKGGWGMKSILYLEYKWKCPVEENGIESMLLLVVWMSQSRTQLNARRAILIHSFELAWHGARRPRLTTKNRDSAILCGIVRTRRPTAHSNKRSGEQLYNIWTTQNGGCCFNLRLFVYLFIIYVVLQDLMAETD
jgi:hypothetical protein